MLKIAELPAACDESYEAGKVFCVAGYMASTETWLKFERQWHELLKDAGVKEIHMTDLVARRERFEGWTWERSQEVQNNVLQLLMFANLRSYVTIIDLRAWRKAAAPIERLRPRGYGAAYLFAFQHQCEMMAHDVRHFPEYERIALLFDEQKEFEGRALALHASLKQSKMLDFISRLGAMTFDDSAKHPSLQAADVLAFEARRHFMAVPYGIEPKRERQLAWKALTLSPNTTIRHFNEATSPAVLEALRLDADARAEREKVQEVERGIRRAARENRAASSSRARRSPSAPSTPPREPTEGPS